MNTPVIVAPACHEAREVVESIVNGPTVAQLPANEPLRAKRITIQLWEICRGSQTGEEEVAVSGETNIKSQRAKLPDAIRERTGF